MTPGVMGGRREVGDGKRVVGGRREEGDGREGEGEHEGKQKQ